ncbi:protein-methionine-sulfoxide reductase heme-binding subunit MsrQ [Alteromonas sp. KUL42]|uniref:sulfite oxidase heme-binding subunit YedZ n=1 Tax=Alteromonas sp. KUL42 TaxID=2480797 RepID=UPI001036D7AB|nr:protein-methionine-sulfoxide reductase heme-binding subunit MsrQ [Alteromonas sp. KUL42]TAP36757.1 sulfoxide reductase heme-binding subunit YedZ [Alteromonas sp. KUL42]GEA06980.1 protein-methionine-sulfoxide reductase heme-binding subunit MsrQ [Alteromonas sp. KUL42]
MPLLKKPVRLSLWQRRGTKAVIHIMAIGYLAWLFLAGLSDKLGPDPVEVLINETGTWAIHFLLLTLSLSPMAKNLPSAEPMQFRRLIGVYTFVYALAHLLTYIAFELQFDMALVASEIISRPYIVVGMTALLLLFILTATSFKTLQRKMGRNWQRLHNTIYIILPLALLHFSWSQKTFWQEPVWYWLLGLLIMSPRIKKWANKVRANRSGSA